MVWGAGLLGAFLPWFIDRQKILTYQRDRFRHFPDFLDLFSVILVSGVNLLDAWRLAVTHLPVSRLKKELKVSVDALDAGRSFLDVLDDLKRKWTDRRLTITLLIIQNAFKQGLPLNEFVQGMAGNLREELFLEIEKQGELAKIQLLFPMIFLIFPSLFIVLFGSLALRFLETNGFF